MTQGQGVTTQRKESGFAYVFSILIGVSKAASVSRYPLWYIDLHAGCGWNHKADCAGSPMVFAKQATRQNRRFHALLCDHNPDAARELRKRMARAVPTHSKVNVFCGENYRHVRKAAATIRLKENRPEHAMGIVLCDPNGWSECRDRATSMLLPRMAELAAEFPKMDFVLNLNFRVINKLYEGCRNSKNPSVSKGFMTQHPTVEEIALSIPRKHWWVRPAMKVTTDRFVTFLGTNFSGLGKTRFLDFFPKGSPEWDQIVKTGELTETKALAPKKKGLFA